MAGALGQAPQQLPAARDNPHLPARQTNPRDSKHDHRPDGPFLRRVPALRLIRRLRRLHEQQAADLRALDRRGPGPGGAEPRQQDEHEQQADHQVARAGPGRERLLGYSGGHRAGQVGVFVELPPGLLVHAQARAAIRKHPGELQQGLPHVAHNRTLEGLPRHHPIEGRQAHLRAPEGPQEQPAALLPLLRRQEVRGLS